MKTNLYELLTKKEYAKYIKMCVLEKVGTEVIQETIDLLNSNDKHEIIQDFIIFMNEENNVFQESEDEEIEIKNAEAEAIKILIGAYLVMKL